MSSAHEGNKRGIYFTDVFNVDSAAMADYGAFNVSPWLDMPLFIDPFLLFASDKAEYQKLHEQIIGYLKYLRDQSVESPHLTDGNLQHLYCFKEVHQNCLGFSISGTRGIGLGPHFGRTLHASLNGIFGDFGDEAVTQESHFEKLSLIQPGVGRDKISDLTTNLIKGFLLDYTETFAKRYIDKSKLGVFDVAKAIFDRDLGVWKSKKYTLPRLGKEYILLTPEDILTKDDTWINKEDLQKDFIHIRDAIPNVELRERISVYFESKLPKRAEKNSRGQLEVRAPTAREKSSAMQKTIQEFPEFIDYYIKYKEDHRREALRRSADDVASVKSQLVNSIQNLVALLEMGDFYKHQATSLDEARKKINWFKHVIEDQDGYKEFYHKGIPIKLESNFQAMFKFVWEGSSFACDAEVNNGRGPVDFKVSKGRSDQTLIEFKLASNSQLKDNLENQVAVYKKANNTTQSYIVLIYFSEAEMNKVKSIIVDLDEAEKAGIILVDARNDNKPSASKVKSPR
jgi:hypothetical protein